MKSRFVSLYLGFVAVVLSVTALGKLQAIFLSREKGCIEVPLFGPLQPVSNSVILSLAALTELLIVMLVCFSFIDRRRQWLTCLASAGWGSICLVARVYFIISGVDCGCLGWLAKPGPVTNAVAGLLALVLAAGGFIAFNIAWRGGQTVEA